MSVLRRWREKRQSSQMHRFDIPGKDYSVLLGLPEELTTPDWDLIVTFVRYGIAHRRDAR